MDIEMKTLGERIEYIRKLRGMSQEELGEYVGRGQSAVYGWEADKSFPRVPELIKIAELGETSVDWLCTGGKGAEKEPISSAALEIARMYDKCTFPHREQIFTLVAACYQSSERRNGNNS